MLGEKRGLQDTMADKGARASRGLQSDGKETLGDSLAPPPALERVRDDRITVMCAEPGMGKSYVVSHVARRAEAVGRKVLMYDYEDMASHVACRRLIRCCRDLSKKPPTDNRPLVVFDGIAPGDEAEVDREARSIKRLASSGAQVVVCLRPEAEQLLEQLVDCCCLRTEDLLFRAHEDENVTMTLTGGIPTLVSGLRADRATGAASVNGGVRYAARMEDLVRKTLREGLPHEELRIRFAMLLLGQGTLDEVKMVAGRCDGEQFAWLERDVPLLGVDARNRSFCCHGLRKDEILDCCGQALHAYAAVEPALVVRACSTLAAREDVRRSAMVSRYCASEQDHASICVTWGVSYVSIGEARLVTEALRYARATDMNLGVRETLSEAAAAAIAGTGRQVDAAWERLASLGLAGSIEERLFRRVQLLGVCRDTLRNPRQASSYMTADAHDAVGLACLDHLRATSMLASGRFDEAYAVMVNEMLVREPHSLPEAMVCDDLLLALALCGGVPDRSERVLFEKTEAFFARPGSRRLQAYHAAVATVPGILMSSSSNASLADEAASHAERAGDSFMQALFLTVCAVADVRAHALTRAHVRAERASKLLRAMGQEYLASSAELVDALALSMLNEKGCLHAYCKVGNRPTSLLMVAKALARASEGIPDGQAWLAVPLGASCPRDVLWLLNLLATGCEGVFGNLTDVVPTEWVEQMRTIKYRQAKGSMHNAAVEDVTGRPSLMKGGSSELGRGVQTEMTLVNAADEHIRVSVFGGFGVRRDGQLLAEGLFERRRARDLVSVLAVAPGHRMRRGQIVEILWPDDEFCRGPRRLYEAVTEARKCLAGLSAKENPIIAEKMQNSIGFDMVLVTCDVDDFEREARTVLAEDGDDFLVLEHARRMDQIYAGGLDKQVLALGGLVADRADALHMLYVDAIIAAGEAALRLGKAKLAVRYGMDAHRMAELREDAAILVVRALKAAGRGFEISDFYRRFSRNLLETEGVPPSMSLRRAVDLALSDVGGGNEMLLA